MRDALPDDSPLGEPEAVLADAWDNIKSGQLEVALRLCERVLSSCPAPADRRGRALLARAVIWSRLGQHARAAEDRLSVLNAYDIPPANRCGIVHNCVIALICMGRFSDAMELMTALLQQMPDSIPYEQRVRTLELRLTILGHLNRYQELLEDATKILQDPQIPSRLRPSIESHRAMSLVKLRRSREATQAFSEILNRPELDPTTHANVLDGRAWTHYLAGELTPAISDARRALALDPERWVGRFNLGLYLLSDKQDGSAEAVYAEALSHCRDLPPLNEAISDLADGLSSGALEARPAVHNIVASLKRHRSSLEAMSGIAPPRG